MKSAGHFRKKSMANFAQVIFPHPRQREQEKDYSFVVNMCMTKQGKRPAHIDNTLAYGWLFHKL